MGGGVPEACDDPLEGDTCPMLFAKWKENSRKLRETFEMSRAWCPWTNASLAPLLRLVPMTPRVHELINIAWGARLSGNNPKQPLTSAQLRKDFFVDISQDVLRRPWGEGVSTVTRGIHES